MKTRKKFSIVTGLFALLMMCSLSGWGQLGKIHGKVNENKQGMPQVKVELLRDGKSTGKGMLTNDKGEYEFAMLEPGAYTIKVSNLGDEIFQNVTLSPGETQPMNIELAKSDPNYEHPGIDVYGAKEIFSVDPLQPITTTHDEIVKAGNDRDINSFVALDSRFVQKDAGDPLNFKGGRDNTSATFMDGIKLRGTDEMPMGAIDQISVMASGLPAEYGDVTGAVIVVTTRNPSMTMGSFGKPLTKAERKALKEQRKRSTGETRLDCELDVACR